jgi:phosphate-selective porin OprO/OprP
MGRHRGTAGLALALALAAGAVMAQTTDPTVQDLRQQLRQAQEALAKQQQVIDALERRLDELEQAQRAGQVASPAAGENVRTDLKASATASPPGFSARWKDGTSTFTFSKAELKLSNRLQFRWTQDNYGDPAVQNGGEFRVRRFKTQIAGWAYTPDLTFRLQVDWANANTPLGVLDDAWVQYDFTHGNKGFMLRAGQGKTPFGRQSIASTATDMFADRSIVTVVFCGIRDVGVMATGQFGPGSVKDLIEYSVGVYNGGGRSVYANLDMGYQTDFRVMVSPWGSAGYDEDNPFGTDKPKLSLGFEYEHNDQRLKDSKFKFISGTEYETVGYDLMFKYKWFTAYGEYFDRGAWDTKNENRKSEGVNAQLGFLVVPRRCEVFLGYWTLDPDTAKYDNSLKQAGIGLNWYFAGNASKLQADLRKIMDDVKTVRDYEFRLQYQIVF